MNKRIEFALSNGEKLVLDDGVGEYEVTYIRRRDVLSTVRELLLEIDRLRRQPAASEAGAVPTPYAIQRLPAVRQALTAYHGRPADEEACAVVRAILAAAPPSAPAADSAEPIPEWRPFALTLAAALERGDDPALLMGKSSPLRQELHRLLATTADAHPRYDFGPEGKGPVTLLNGDRMPSYAAPAQLSGISGELDAQGDERALPWENFPAYLIDHCEGDTITEEGLQRAVAGMLSDPKYAALSPQPSAPASADDAARWRELDKMASDPEFELSLNNGGWVVLKMAIDAALAAAKPVIRDSLIAEPAGNSGELDDTARLDWLDATNKPFKMGWQVGIAPAGNVRVQGVIQLAGEPTPIREAIDAARAQRAAEGNGDADQA